MYTSVIFWSPSNNCSVPLCTPAMTSCNLSLHCCHNARQESPHMQLFTHGIDSTVAFEVVTTTTEDVKMPSSQSLFFIVSICNILSNFSSLSRSWKLSGAISARTCGEMRLASCMRLVDQIAKISKSEKKKSDIS